MDKKLLIIAAVTFIIILAFGVVMAFLIKQNSECTQNPFVYGAKNVKTQDGQPAFMVCSCQLEMGTFYFDKDGMYEENPLLANLNITERGFIP